jgi:hypothetical protein
MQSANISILVDPGDVHKASKKLDRAFEDLAGRRIKAIHYPVRFADRLGIAHQDGTIRSLPWLSRVPEPRHPVCHRDRTRGLMPADLTDADLDAIAKLQRDTIGGRS